MTDILKEVSFENGLTLQFLDRSNRYFGDYNRLAIDIDAYFKSAQGTIHLRYQRPLTRMGVESADLDSVASELIEQFLHTAVPYLKRSDYLVKLQNSLANGELQVWNQID